METKIKKDCIALMTLLNANLDKKVKTVLPALLELAQYKGRSAVGSTYMRLADGTPAVGKEGEEGYVAEIKGTVIAVRCSYFKKWFTQGIDDGVNNLPFGVKLSNSSGLNNMSLAGFNQSRKQSNELKMSSSEMIKLIEEGTAGDDIPAFIKKYKADAVTASEVTLDVGEVVTKIEIKQDKEGADVEVEVPTGVDTGFDTREETQAYLEELGYEVEVSANAKVETTEA